MSTMNTAVTASAGNVTRSAPSGPVIPEKPQAGMMKHAGPPALHGAVSARSTRPPGSTAASSVTAQSAWARQRRGRGQLRPPAPQTERRARFPGQAPDGLRPLTAVRPAPALASAPRVTAVAAPRRRGAGSGAATGAAQGQQRAPPFPPSGSAHVLHGRASLTAAPGARRVCEPRRQRIPFCITKADAHRDRKVAAAVPNLRRRDMDRPPNPMDLKGSLPMQHGRLGRPEGLFAAGIRRPSGRIVHSFP